MVSISDSMAVCWRMSVANTIWACAIARSGLGGLFLDEVGFVVEVEEETGYDSREDLDEQHV